MASFVFALKEFNFSRQLFECYQITLKMPLSLLLLLVGFFGRGHEVVFKLFAPCLVDLQLY